MPPAIDFLPDELSAEVLELMRRRESAQVESLLEYGDKTAGRIMNPQVFALNEDLTVGEAITELQMPTTWRWCSTSTSWTLAVTWSASPRSAGCCSCRPRRRSSGSWRPTVTSVRVDAYQEEVARRVAS